MIERYTRKEMEKVWNDRSRYFNWLKVEYVVCEELSNQGDIPKTEWLKLKKKLNQMIKRGGIDPKKILQHEKKVKHDVIAFTTAVAEEVGPESRYVHFGLTSSDVLDTAFALQVRDAGKILLEDVQVLLKTLKEKSKKYQELPTIGRSHGIHAEPTSFGLKYLGWYSEWSRNLKRLEFSLENARFGKLSGAVGVNPHWSPDFESAVLDRLGLMREPVSTQVVPRDRFADVLNAIALCGACLERMAVELRHLQRSEVGEVIEGFQKGQKGSSAMPHKRNPISTENITGCSRMLRSYASAGLENVVLWHERDISHSSVERVFFPDAFILLDYALVRMNNVLNKLGIRKEKVKGNLNLAGSTVFSGHYLLELVKKGVTREEAYSWIQECALRSYEEKKEFVHLLKKHPKISRYLSQSRIERLGTMKYQLRNVKKIYAKTFKAYS